MSSDDELSSTTSSSCDVESLQLGVEGEGSLNSIVQSAIVEERDVMEEDVDDEDGIRFATLETKERVLNW